MDYKQNKDYINEHATKFALLGATNFQLAKMFGVAETTFEKWLQKYPELRDAVEQGRDFADAEVAEALYKRATGKWKQRAVKIMQYQGDEVIVPYIERFAPDVSAAQYWLNNRRAKRKDTDPLRWNSRQATEVTGKDGGDVRKVTRIEHVIIDPAKTR